MAMAILGLAAMPLLCLLRRAVVEKGKRWLSLQVQNAIVA